VEEYHRGPVERSGVEHVEPQAVVVEHLDAAGA
jgi:hypothetical protein